MTVDFQRLQSDISDCRSLLLSIQAHLNTQSQYKAEDTSAETFLSVKQAAELLDIAPQTIYQRIRNIPHTKRFGKLYFLKSELLAYLKEG